MTDADKLRFAEMMGAIYSFYNKDLSESALHIWWATMRHFDLAAVREALSRHAMNPDSGQFIPKPADVVKMLGGSTLDTALVALHKLEEAISRVGNYATVVFDDPLIHRVVEEMGGWVQVCLTKQKDWEFRRNEFLNRYRSYKSRGEVPPYLPKLTGTHDAENEANGFPAIAGNTHLIGDVAAARRVMAGGTGTARLGVHKMSEIAGPAFVALVDLEGAKR